MNKKEIGTILGIIPARGGSKAVPKKNIRLLNGKPLIYYTIHAARGSKYLTDFVVTTDDKEIAKVARQYGVAVIKRPHILARDDTSMVSVVSHVLTFYERNKQKVDIIVLLQPTCPLRTSKDIDDALDLLYGRRADAVISVYRVFDHHPARMYTLNHGKLTSCKPELQWSLKQKLPAMYLRNGALYIIKRNIFMKKNSFFGQNTHAYIMSDEHSINIDEEIDLLLAGLVMKKNND